MKPSMKAALIHSFEGIEKVEISEVSVPSPQPNEVQIAIQCAGVNPVDWKITEGAFKTHMDYQFPIILGWDLSGVVSKVGKAVKQIKEGDPVFAYCRKDILHDGAYAEYICLDAEYAVLKPTSLTFAEAASVPLSSLTAWQSLFETAHLKSKDKILIHAGAGGVGGFAIQFAKLVGAHVITTTSQSNHEYVTHLGADEVIDYTKGDFLEILKKRHPRGVDVVYDTVGGETLKLSYDAVKDGGRIVTIAGVVDQVVAAERHLTAEFVFVRPDKQQLKKIAELIDLGKVSVPHIQEISFIEVASALRKSREGHTQGKLVLHIAN